MRYSLEEILWWEREDGYVFLFELYLRSMYEKLIVLRHHQYPVYSWKVADWKSYIYIC